MTGTNDFLVWDGSSTNIESQADYLVDSRRTAGATSGIAPSNVFNKAQRQASIMAALIGQFIVDLTGADAIDDGTITTLLSNFLVALGRGSGLKNVAVYKIVGGVQEVSLNGASFTATGATTFNQSYSGTAFIRAVGAGGGSGSAVSGGASGGASAGTYAEAYIHFVAGVGIAVSIGTGGAGGVGSAGGAGNPTTFGSLSCPGGLGSPQVSSATFGAGAAAPANATGAQVSIPGQSGSFGGNISGQIVAGNGGAPSFFGGGGFASGAGEAPGAGAGGTTGLLSTSGLAGGNGYLIAIF